MSILSFEKRIYDLFGIEFEREAASFIQAIISDVDEELLHENRQLLIASTNMELITEALGGEVHEGDRYVFIYAWKSEDSGRIALFDSTTNPTLATGTFVNDFIYKNKIYNGFLFKA